MNPAIDEFFERPLSHKVGVLVGLVLFCSYVFWQFFYKEPFEKLDETNAKIAQLESDISVQRRNSRDLPKLRREAEQLDIKLKKVLQQLPDKREIPELLASVSSLAGQSGLEDSLFRPNPERIHDFYAENSNSVTVTGTFHEIATFFDEVGRLPRIVNIDQISIGTPKITPEKILLKADCNVTTYRFLDESERIQAANQEEAQQKKRR